MVTRFAFLPFAQSEVLAGAGVLGPTGRRQLGYDVEVRGDGAAHGARLPIGGELLGPGDVTGIHRAMISRVEPRPGLTAFEPAYMPFVEFVDADFPWRYSLDRGSATRIRPWLVLLALRADEFEFRDAGAGPLPRIQVSSSAKSLPDLGQSWAFAHVQVALTESAGTVAASLAASPLNHFSRLLCARKLEERTGYNLFLVPAYEAGRLSGLGETGTPATPDAPAWTTSADQSVLLPVYFQSRFITDSMLDIEAILSRLRGVLPGETGEAGASRRASAANPGYYADFTDPGAEFGVQAALKRVDTEVPGLETNAALAARMSVTLADVIAGENAAGLDDEDPLVAFPPYGFRYRPDGAPERAKALDGEWYDLVNLDLKFRHAAGLGAETVRRNQEYFASLCWEQYAQIVEANQRLVRLRHAEVLARALIGKHVSKLPADTLLALAEPLQPYVLSKPNKAVVAALRETGVSTSFASRGLRRLSSKRAVVVAARSKEGGATRRTLIPAPSLPGDRTRNPLTASLQRESFDKPSDPVLRPTGIDADLGDQLARLFVADAFTGAARANNTAVAVKAFRSADLSNKIVQALGKLPKAKAQASVQGLLDAEAGVIQPVFRGPVITTPLSDKLKAFAEDAILNDASRLPPETVSMFEENRQFLEAFLVGANHEMNSELRWREFPTDLRSTIFRRFWNRGAAPDDESSDDISAIDTWQGALGAHFGPGDLDRAANLVIVIRSELIRKFVLPILVINEANGTEWKENEGTDHQAVFFGTLGPDVAFYGFGVSREHILGPVHDRAFLVIYEPAGRLRFGLDVATAATRQSRRNTDRQSQRFPIRAFSRDERVVLMHSKNPAPVPANADTWDDFSWSHVTLTPASYVSFAESISISGQPDYWGPGKTSASLARSFWQKPVAAVMPLKRVL